MVDNKFRSKIDIFLVLFLALILGGALVRLLLDANWKASMILIFQIAFITHLFYTTFYSIKNKTLVIKSGFIVNTSLDISSITKISETNSIWSAPAISFDRLEILYNKNKTILISPKEKTKFLEEIKRINPEIEIVLKK
ncbi:PH domain-containing protein [Flavobacterium johnsoniae]|uniref:PH domain-containing protein n=1 Tax=Flavobacterium johnsoniae TaxID=986 RepID=UPI0025AEE70C|nr:PH domain-containing protein [Flavobacterium johnsoniae]WJS96943.1 PH domain-containing protein [Flavobacterium johnsoniae]